MKINDLKVGDKVKFHKGAAIVSGFISYIYPSGKFLMDDTTIWGSDIIAKIEEEEIPIDKPIKYEFEFNTSYREYVIGKEDKIYVNGHMDGYEAQLKIPFLSKEKIGYNKKFKVTVEEVE
jgi:hypothetical protein